METLPMFLTTPATAVVDSNFTFSTTSYGVGDVNGTAWGPNSTTNANDPYHMCEVIKVKFQFDHIQLARVIMTWVLFLISLAGNVFVFACVYRNAKSSHIYLIMTHLSLSDLVFTILVMPADAVWNTTMMWHGGDVLCRLVSFFRTAALYLTAFMVVVTALDRCITILLPMASPTTQRLRTRILLATAWCSGILLALPAVVIFSIREGQFCPGIKFVQCMDSAILNPQQLKKYNFFSMFLAFILPFICVLISYWLVLWEISNMVKRDRIRLQRRCSDNSLTILRARKKILKLTMVVTAAFLILWGPYYVIAIYIWFNESFAEVGNRTLQVTVFLLLYCHPAVHPFLFGSCIREVRENFKAVLLSIVGIITCNPTKAKAGRSQIGFFKRASYSNPAISNGRKPKQAEPSAQNCSKLTNCSSIGHSHSDTSGEIRLNGINKNPLIKATNNNLDKSIHIDGDRGVHWVDKNAKDEEKICLNVSSE